MCTLFNLSDQKNLKKIKFAIVWAEWRRHPFLMATAFTTALLPHYLEVLGLLTLIPVIQSTDDKPYHLHLGPFGELTLDWSLNQWLLVMGLFFSLQMAINLLRCWSAQRLVENVVLYRRKNLFRYLISQGYLRLINMDKGQMGQIFLQEIQAIGRGHLGALNIVAASCFVASVLILLLWWSWGLTLLLLPFALILLEVMHLCNRYVRQWIAQSFDAQRQTSSFILETWQNLSMILLSQREDKRTSEFEEVIAEQSRWDLKRESLYGTSMHLTRYIIFMTLVILLFLHGQLPPASGLTASELIVFLMVLSRLQPILSTVSGDFSNLVTGSIAHHKIELIEHREALSPVPKGDQEFNEIHKLELREFSFTYPDQKSPVLQLPSLILHNGCINVISGPSGCGKSTLLNTLAKLHAGYHGEIFIDGVEYAQLHQNHFYAKVAMVPQDGEFFMLSLKENLCFSQMAEESEVLKLAERCGLAEVFQSLPKGLDTPMLAAGKNFSGGQKKRLSILRALLSHPVLLFLDEPTAGLDESAARGIVDLLLELKKNMMLVVVSHDPIVLEEADHLVKLS